jgi:hypothetical protein
VRTDSAQLLDLLLGRGGGGEFFKIENAKIVQFMGSYTETKYTLLANIR